MIGLTLALGMSSTVFAETSSLPTLDGKTFHGNIGMKGKKNKFNDDLVFKDGTFLSTACQKSDGFGPAKYETSSTGKDIGFTVISTNDKGSKMNWKGTIHGNTASADIVQTNADGTVDHLWYKGKVAK